MSWHIPNIMMLAADRLTQFLYWSTKGRLGERQLSYSILLLHTIGRKTGKRRTHALLYFRAGDNLVICASNNGSDRLPAWYLNLQAHPRVWIQHGRMQREVLAETAGPEERERLWQQLLKVRHLGSEGHTGRHLAAFYDTVLDGEAWYYSEGQLTRAVYKPGDYVFVGKGQSAGMHYPDHVWMLEYARGSMPALIPFGLADAVFSTLDYKTAWQTIAIYLSLVMKQLSRGQKMMLGTLAAVALVVWALGGTRRLRKK